MDKNKHVGSNLDDFMDDDGEIKSEKQGEISDTEDGVEVELGDLISSMIVVLHDVHTTQMKILSLLQKPARKARQTNSTTGDTAYTPEFEEAWALVPSVRKLGKKAAFREYKRALKNTPECCFEVTPDLAIKQAIKHYYEMCLLEGRQKRHMYHLSTFLGPDDWWHGYVNPPPENAFKGPSRGSERGGQTKPKIDLFGQNVHLGPDELRGLSDKQVCARWDHLIRALEKEGREVEGLSKELRLELKHLMAMAQIRSIEMIGKMERFVQRRLPAFIDVAAVVESHRGFYEKT